MDRRIRTWPSEGLERGGAFRQRCSGVLHVAEMGCRVLPAPDVVEDLLVLRPSIQDQAWLGVALPPDCDSPRIASSMVCHSGRRGSGGGRAS
jgi:hypothetical protein